MRSTTALLSAILTACAGSPPPVAADAASQRCARLFERALADNQAIATLAGLLEAAPNRLSGSLGADAAVRWGLAAMQAMGLENVRAEPCTVPKWVRGLETAAVEGPDPFELRVVALGGSIGTAPAGVVAEVVEVRSFEQLQALGEAARGKIVFFNRPMPRILKRTGPAYGEAVPQRTNGAIEAGKAGAVAALVRSVTTAIDGFPHTGAMHYADGVARVPAAAIATADAEALAARLRQGPVRVRLVLGCRDEGEVPSANVVGELRGTGLPDEIVLLGAHLDAWDIGHGAHDDGAGCAHVLEALRLLQVCGIRPKRTIRAVLFMNEENGLRGAEAYAKAHEHEHHAAAVETDSGGFTPQGFTCSLAAEQVAELRRAFAPLDEFGAGAFVPGGGGGADIAPLGRRGVPMFLMMVDGHRYFDYHHSARDTIEVVNERELALGAAALAYAASVLAEQ
jgi:Zn-dependent M28 family amino/carboxypeptidase